MEEIKICKKCGARLLEYENCCPVCNTMQDIDDTHDIVNDSDEDISTFKNAEKKNYWKNPIIWAISIILVIVSTVLNVYLNDNPIELVDSDEINNEEYIDSALTINSETSQFAQATNNNMLAISYVNQDKAYIVMNQELFVYDKKLNNRELVFNQNLTTFSEDDKYYYYLDEKNNYLRVEKESKKEDILLTEVYYVQNLGEKVYYQKDSDNESIYCLDLLKNEDKKINDEVSYSLIIDEKKERIFYVNKNAELITIALDGSDRRALASNTNIYTYDGKYLYYINDKGLIRCDLNGEHSVIYENNNLKLVNIVDDHLIVHDGNIIYTMTLEGKNVKKLYTIETMGKLTFEVVGDKLLVLTSVYQEENIGYEIVSLDGKRHLLESNDTPQIIGEEI